jgi:hypothetical protein
MKTRSLRLAAVTTVVAIGSLVGLSTASAGVVPSGEVTVGHTTIEPAYNDANGQMVYLSTPSGVQVNANSHDVAPIYMPVYPVGSSVGTLNCEDQTAATTENCPDHGPLLAGLVESIAAHMGSSVYSGGVLGHDHILGVPSTGGDWNVDWLPVIVVFTPQAVTDGAINAPITTVAELDSLVANNDVIEVPLPPATFHCAVVSAAVYDHGTPVAY